MATIFKIQNNYFSNLSRFFMTVYYNNRNTNMEINLVFNYNWYISSYFTVMDYFMVYHMQSILYETKIRFTFVTICSLATVFKIVVDEIERNDFSPYIFLKGNVHLLHYWSRNIFYKFLWILFIHIIIIKKYRNSHLGERLWCSEVSRVSRLSRRHRLAISYRLAYRNCKNSWVNRNLNSK